LSIKLLLLSIFLRHLACPIGFWWLGSKALPNLLKSETNSMSCFFIAGNFMLPPRLYLSKMAFCSPVPIRRMGLIPTLLTFLTETGCSTCFSTDINCRGCKN
jgi:hypothetical protein